MIDWEKGLICFSGGDEFIQKCIRFFTSSRFSHTFVTVDCLDNYLYAFETTSTIVCLSPVHRKMAEKNYIEAFRIKDNRKREIFNTNVLPAVNVYAGTWYGYLSYFWFIYRFLMRKIGVEPTKMWKWCNSGVTCTELHMIAFFATFPELIIPGRDINTFAPQELYDIIKKHPEEFELIGEYVYAKN